jgi:hypothetical protein
MWYSIGMRVAILAAISFGIWVFPAQHGPPKKGVVQSNGTASAQKSAESQQNRESPESEAIQGLIRQLQAREQDEAQERHSQENKAHQDVAVERKLVKYTRWLVIVGVLQAAVLLLTVIVIYLQVASTRNSERAWMFVDIGKLPPFNGDALVLWVMPFAKNEGKTVARITRTSLQQRTIEAGQKLPEVPEYTQQATVDFMLPPNGGARPMQVGFVPSDFINSRNEGKTIYLYGFIDYVDAFRKTRQTRFCYYYHVQHGADPAEDRFYIARDVPIAYTRCT